MVVFTKALLDGQFIVYKGDPLLDFGLISFLDKFVYKNPRARERLSGGSIMQALRSRTSSTPLNSKKFLAKPETQISEEDVSIIFYQTCTFVVEQFLLICLDFAIVEILLQILLG